MTDTFEKTYTDWSIDVGEYKYEGITLKEVEQNLYSIQDNDIDFLIVSPSKAISVDNKLYNFVQVCSDQHTELLHIEISVTAIGEEGAIIYGKNELGHQEAFQIIENFIVYHKMPVLDEWDIVLDLRPKMESYITGANDD